MNAVMNMRSLALMLPVLLLIALPAYALSLDAARDQGYVGEQRDGYVGIVKNAPGVKELVNDVNTKRKIEYQKISAKNGQPVNVVAKIAAEKIINKLKSGHYYQDGGGNWVKK